MVYVLKKIITSSSNVSMRVCLIIEHTVVLSNMCPCVCLHLGKLANEERTQDEKVEVDWSERKKNPSSITTTRHYSHGTPKEAKKRRTRNTWQREFRAETKEMGYLE